MASLSLSQVGFLSARRLLSEGAPKATAVKTHQTFDKLSMLYAFDKRRVCRTHRISFDRVIIEYSPVCDGHPSFNAGVGWGGGGDLILTSHSYRSPSA